MLKRILGTTAALALFALPLVAQAAPMAKPAAGSPDVTITGTVIDTYCNTTQGASGAAHKACATACAGKGVSLAILGSDGIIYLPVSSKAADGQNERLLPFAEGKVKVTGVHRENHGLHTIEIRTIEAAT
jgi:hypothetical protein